MEDYNTEQGVRPDINYNSPEWGKVEEWLAAELLSLYKEIASIHIEEKDAMIKRGKASMVEKMLSFRSLNDVYEPR